MLKKILAIVLPLVITLTAHAQDQQRAEEYRLQQEQYRKSLLLRELDSGVVFMDNGQYTAADKKFRLVLDNIKSVPSDLVFYFGKNSFYLENYKQSIDWLTKYIQLKGTTAQFSQEAVQWLKKAEAEFVHIKSKEAKKAEQVLSTDYDVDCGPTGKVMCPVCKGDHVIVKPGPLGTEYRTCQYCNEQGILTCEEYNKLVRGELTPRTANK